MAQNPMLLSRKITSIVVYQRNFGISATLGGRKVAGKYKSTRDKSKMLTYEMAHDPTQFGMKKAWLTWHTQNLEEFRQVQPQIHIQDEVIRRFMRGFFDRNVIRYAEDLVIKRRGNLVVIAGIMKKGPIREYRRLYWMLGFAEEFFRLLLKQPVKLELQFVRTEKNLTYKYV